MPPRIRDVHSKGATYIVSVEIHGKQHTSGCVSMHEALGKLLLRAPGFTAAENHGPESGNESQGAGGVAEAELLDDRTETEDHERQL